jgi:hypothetical protein
VREIWRAFGLKPWGTDSFKVSPTRTLDNLQTHKTPLVHKWLLRHRRFHLHFTPTYGSWTNLVER